jgi:hypothetical protein
MTHWDFAFSLQLRSQERLIFYALVNSALQISIVRISGFNFHDHAAVSVLEHDVYTVCRCK